MSFSFGIDDFDGRATFAGKQSRNHSTVLGTGGIGTKVSFNISIGIENMGEQFISRMDRRSGQVGAHLSANSRMRVAFSTLRSVDHLAFDCVSAE